MLKLQEGLYHVVNYKKNRFISEKKAILNTFNAPFNYHSHAFFKKPALQDQIN